MEANYKKLRSRDPHPREFALPVWSQPHEFGAAKLRSPANSVAPNVCMQDTQAYTRSNRCCMRRRVQFLVPPLAEQIELAEKSCRVARESRIRCVQDMAELMWRMKETEETSAAVIRRAMTQIQSSHWETKNSLEQSHEPHAN